MDPHEIIFLTWDMNQLREKCFKRCVKTHSKKERLEKSYQIVKKCRYKCNSLHH